MYKSAGAPSVLWALKSHIWPLSVQVLGFVRVYQSQWAARHANTRSTSPKRAGTEDSGLGWPSALEASSSRGSAGRSVSVRRYELKGWKLSSGTAHRAGLYLVEC